MAVLAVISIMIGYVLVKESAGRIAGWIWIALGVNSSYLLIHLRRAMGESPVLACVALAAFLCYQVLLLLKTQKPIPPWKLLVGLSMLGAVAGSAAKLNGLSVVLAGVVLAILVATKLESPIDKKMLFASVAALIVILSSLFTFVGLNPYLWSEPVGRTQKMFEFRLEEMDRQQRKYPEERIDSLGYRVRVIPSRVFHTHAAMNWDAGWGINILLFLAGLCYIVAKSWKSLSKGEIDPAPVAIILVGLATATPPLLTPLDSDRYYLFPVFFTTLFIAIGAAAVAKVAYVRFKMAYRHDFPNSRIQLP